MHLKEARDLSRVRLHLFAPAEDQNGKVVSKVWFPFRSEGHTLIVLRQDAEAWWHIAIWTEHYVEREEGRKLLSASVSEVYVLKLATAI